MMFTAGNNACRTFVPSILVRRHVRLLRVFLNKICILQ